MAEVIVINIMIDGFRREQIQMIGSCNCPIEAI